MDRYSKIVLTIIALALVTLNVQLLRPTPTSAGMFDGAPTLGDLKEADDKLAVINEAPIVAVIYSR